MTVYRFIWLVMVLSFSFLGFHGPDIKSKLIGFLLSIVNGLIFWR